MLEALETAELMYLFDREGAELVIIASDVQELEMLAVQQRWRSMTLKPEATTEEVLWELANPGLIRKPFVLQLRSGNGVSRDQFGRAGWLFREKQSRAADHFPAAG